MFLEVSPIAAAHNLSLLLLFPFTGTAVGTRSAPTYKAQQYLGICMSTLPPRAEHIPLDVNTV